MNLAEPYEKRTSTGLILIFIFLTLGILVGGYVAYRNYEQNYRTEAERQLSSIAELKVNQLVQWRKERLGDANLFYRNSTITVLVKRFFNDPKDIEAKKSLQTWIEKFAITYHYNRVCLHDSAGIERLSCPKTNIHPPLEFFVHSTEAMKSGHLIFHDFFRDENDQRVYLNIFVPVVDEKDNSKVLGIFSIRIDPTTYLYPYIQSWPTLSKTSETLIIRRDGDDALFLNELRFQKNTSLNLRSPPGNENLPALKAALGQEGIVDGLDYRGVPVIAYVRAVPDSPWFLVAKTDIEEVYAPIRERLWLMMLLMVTLICGSGTGVGLIWRQQRLRFFKERFHSAEVLRESEKRFDLAMKASNDGLFDWNLETNNIYYSPAWKKMLGYEDHELPNDFSIWEKLTEKEDVKKSWELQQKLISKQIDRFVLEFKMKHKEGHWVDILSKAEAIFNDNGKAIRIVGTHTDITERKLAEESLRESEARFHSLFDNMAEGVALHSLVYNEDGEPINYRIVDVNQQFERIIGVNKTDIAEKLATEAYGTTDPPYGAEYIQVALKHEPCFFEAYFAPLQKHFSISAVPWGTNGFATIFQDITDRKQTEEKLISLSSRQEAILAAVPAIIMEVDDQKEYTWANFAGLEFFGMDVIGKSADFYFEGEQDTYKTVQPLFNGYENLIYVESWQRRKDGKKRLLAWWCRVLKDENGNVSGALSAARDITEYKLAEDEIRQLNIELEDRVIKRTAQLEAANKELEAFSYSVSHDLRAPLRHISGYVDLLANRFQSVLTDKGLHYLNSIANSVRHMGTLIDDLLQFSKSGRAEMRESKLDMNQIVKEVCKQFRQDNPERNIEWTLGQLPSVHGDSAMLKLVWINLLSNAVKFTRKKKNAKIEIGFLKDKKEIVFFVRDNGVGFDMKYAQKLFGVFQRLHPIEDFEGTGIGLANVNRIVSRHGGRIWAEAELDKGASFYFTLPKKS